MKKEIGLVKEMLNNCNLIPTVTHEQREAVKKLVKFAEPVANIAEEKLARLEYLRGELRAERISTGELAELQSLAAFIAPGDVELLEAAGVPESQSDDLWKISTHEDTGEIVVRDGNGNIVANCECDLHTDNKKQRALKNAVLIASTPALMAALDGLLGDNHDSDGFGACRFCGRELNDTEDSNFGNCTSDDCWGSAARKLIETITNANK
jgi:hypothetical protein